jgi:hypothetical protein
MLSEKNNLTYEDVKNLADKYGLPCKNIYELHAEFNGLLDMAAQHAKAREPGDESSDDGS